MKEFLNARAEIYNFPDISKDNSPIHLIKYCISYTGKPQIHFNRAYKLPRIILQSFSPYDIIYSNHRSHFCHRLHKI